MKRISIPIAAILAAAAAAVAAQAAAAPTVKVATTSKGKILETKSGSTLYAFSRDKGKNTCVAISGCSSEWPSLTVRGKPVAGAGANRKLLGTVKTGGKTQVTYAGHPLYTFASEPKGTAYVGTPEFGGTWEAVTASGKIVK